MSEIAGDELAERLLEIGAVVLSPAEPFTWASGLKSPIYCDNRMTLGFPDLRQAISDGFVHVARPYAPERVVGTATAGIPHAAWLAHRMDLPMCYVRSGSKKHGRGKQIEGPLAAGDRVVLVEDLVSTGMSSIAAVNVLQEAGAEVKAVLAVFSYGLMQSREAFEEAAIPLHTLATFGDLVQAAGRLGALSGEEIGSLKAWHEDPVAWSANQGETVA